MFDLLDLIFAFGFGCLFTASVCVIAITTVIPPRLKVQPASIWDEHDWKDLERRGRAEIKQRARSQMDRSIAGIALPLTDYTGRR
jgi:hypothetical protein